jgi:hypothetical protein
VKADVQGGGDVGELGLLVQEQGQAGALEQVRLGGAAARQQPSLDDELSGEVGPVQRRGPRHGVGLWVTNFKVLTGRALTVDIHSTEANPTVVSAHDH